MVEYILLALTISLYLSIIVLVFRHFHVIDGTAGVAAATFSINQRERFTNQLNGVCVILYLLCFVLEFAFKE